MSDNPARKSFRSRKRQQAGAGGTPEVVYAESLEHAQALLDDSYLGKFKAVPWDEWERVGLPQEETHGGAPAAQNAALRALVAQLDEPLCDATFRARLLRQGLSTDEMAQYVALVERERADVKAALRNLRASRSDASETAVPCTCTGHADESGIHFDSSRCPRHRAANAAHPEAAGPAVPGGGQPALDACTGAILCPATVHIHGCFAECLSAGGQPQQGGAR